MARGAKNGTGLKVTDLGLRKMQTALGRLVSMEVLVGYPEEGASRKEVDPGDPITNAALAYIHDNGSPEANIPARSFMRPGIASAEKPIGDHMVATAKALLKDPNLNIEARLHRPGQAAVLGIKKTINNGVPPPLADSTLRARARRGRKGAKLELELRANGMTAGMDAAKPLVDTGQLRNAATYVVRKKGS